MEGPGGARDARFSLAYGMGALGGVGGEPEGGLYGLGGGGGRLLHAPHAHAQQPPPHRALKRPGDACYDERLPPSMAALEPCAQQLPPPNDMHDDYAPLQPKKSPPSNGKKTKGRVKIKMEYIDNKLRRYTTFSKRKTGIMKKAYELSTLTGTQVMLLVASETGHVYTFATRKLQPMITSDSGKRLIQTCLNSPDPPQGAAHGGDQRMSATGFEETELTYNIADEETKCERSPMSSGVEDSGEESGSEPESPGQRQRSPSPEMSNAPRENSADNANTLFTTPGGVLYPPGMILSLAAAAQAQDQGGTAQPQFITIPLSMAMAAAAASQQTTTVAALPSTPQTNGLQDLSRPSRK